MQKYEFCSIRRRYGRKKSKQYTLRYYLVSYTQTGTSVTRLKRDKAKEDKSAEDAFARTVAQLGLDGWQLSSGSAGDLFFQRPIP